VTAGPWPQRVREAREAEDPARLLEHIPYMGFLGLEVRLVDGAPQVTLPFSEHLVGDSGLPALHGGTLGALLESVAIFGVMWAADTLPRTIGLTVDYLRTGHPKDTHARSEIVKLGRRVANVRCLAWQDDLERPIAQAHLHLLVG
jgi:uncharacterized protein (TIGR00369 family)